MTSRFTPYALAAPAAALVVGLLVSPLVLLVRLSLFEPGRGRGFYVPGTWTAENFAAALDGHGQAVAVQTLQFGTTVAALSVVIGYGLALFIRSLPTGWRGPALACVLLPKVASALVVLFGLRILLGDAGLANRLLHFAGLAGGPVHFVYGPVGAVLGELFLILPYSVLILFVQLGTIDPTLTSAARGLGASRAAAFRRVTLPLSLPGLALAGQLALVWGVAAFLGPLLLGGPDEATAAVDLYRQAFEYGRWPRAAAGAVLLEAALAAGLALSAVPALLRRGGR